VAACEYGGTKGIFGYGWDAPSASGALNLVSNTGVVASDTTAVGTAFAYRFACSYSADRDKGIFRGGYNGGIVSTSNLISNTGVVASDLAGVGTAARSGGGCEYGQDKGIFGYGYSSCFTAVTNLVSNVGVVASDVAGTGTAREQLPACSFN